MKLLAVIIVSLISIAPANAASSGGGSAPAQKPVSTNLPLTLDEVKKHNSAGDCWSIIDGNVYDLTNWVESHPGGKERITAICGKDGTSSFLGKHSNSNSAKSQLTRFELGKVSSCSYCCNPNSYYAGHQAVISISK
jgi:hypothetical protein